ncbi:hypothetical protein [Campylobacter sp. 2018MI13]|uniref:hypothetical protein n=1 Tax=Campylobacter sp. 2018MI13 TaxID=2836737 RepID=UPI001BD99416|nr:hypothetical protein [Campylobacter sp. 2018MI13]MBT0881935.1 hypothetical protein [Campylobacter sp. 2018MI13]
MKVYAQFFNDNGNEFRLNTLLCFGTSSELIGSIVMLNPGSATPNDNVADLEKISNFYKDKKQIDLGNWKFFSPDSTMRQVEKMFNGSYIGKPKELNGVIQIFNLFNLKNQNLNQAIYDLNTIKSRFLFSDDIDFYNKSVYFGFSQAIFRNDVLYNKAKDIFTKTSKSLKSIYSDNFDDNSFYHPGYINRAYKRENIRNLLIKFNKSI